MDKRGGIRWVVRHPWRSLLVVICCAWLIDHAGRPVWMRPPGADDSTPLRAFINPNGDLSDNPNQSIGTLRYFRAMESCDERLLATDLHEWRHLQVTIKGDALAANDAEQWRWRAAKHFRSPIILLGEFDGVRRLWLGYPGEWLLLLLLGTGLICGCWLAFLALRAVIEFFVFHCRFATSPSSPTSTTARAPCPTACSCAPAPSPSASFQRPDPRRHGPGARTRHHHQGLGRHRSFTSTAARSSCSTSSTRPATSIFTTKCRRPSQACEGAILVVDATQGVQAQTVANAYAAIERRARNHSGHQQDRSAQRRPDPRGGGNRAGAGLPRRRCDPRLRQDRPGHRRADQPSCATSSPPRGARLARPAP